MNNVKKILFTGFFGMKDNHAIKYIKMWEKLNCEVDYVPYKIMDIVIPKNNYNIVTKYKNYDYAYCISGGCIYLHHLTFNKNVKINNIIFDSGPYDHTIQHFEYFVHNNFNLHFLPVNNIITQLHKFKNVDNNYHTTNYHNNVLYTNIPKMILTCKNDNIVNKNFLNNYINSQKANNIIHVEFEKGKHADLYRYNEKLYIDNLYNYISTDKLSI